MTKQNHIGGVGNQLIAVSPEYSPKEVTGGTILSESKLGIILVQWDQKDRGFSVLRQVPDGTWLEVDTFGPTEESIAVARYLAECLEQDLA